MKLRESKSEKEFKVVTGDFVENVGKTTLSDLSLDELVDRFIAIDNQAHLLKGLILLEARARFPSDKEFGQWVISTGINNSTKTRQIRTQLMNLAGYFKDKDTTGISLSACYEISAPINADVADKVYQAALNKNLSVAQIKAEIAKAKGLLPESVNGGSGEPELMPLEDISRFMEQVLADVGELPKNEAMRVLKECMKEIQKSK
jgi:hypothetical protein